MVNAGALLVLCFLIGKLEHLEPVRSSNIISKIKWIKELTSSQIFQIFMLLEERTEM